LESVAAKNSHVAMLKLDGWALGFTFALSLLTTVLFGLLPAIQASQVNLNDALKEGGNNKIPGQQQNRLRSLLVITEIALAMILLTGAGLMIKSFWQLSHINRGFEAANVLTAKIDLAGNRYKEPEQFVAFYQQLLERVYAIPGVQHAGITNGFIDRGWKVAVAEQLPVPEDESSLAGRYPVSTDYFQTMGIPLHAGRFFTDRDSKGAPPVVIIDEVLAQRFFPGENPIGKHLLTKDTLLEIVGVVGATRPWKPYSYGQDEAFPRTYLPYQQEGWQTTMSLMVRAQSGDATKLIPAIRQELAAIDKDQPIHSFKPLEQSTDELLRPERFSTLLLAAFGALAMLLATLGIYGLMSYTVSQRTHEMGIRTALGAQSRDVLKLILKQGIMLTLSGVAIGLIASILLTRLMKTMLFGVSATDPLTFVVIAVLLIMAAIVACYLPARRATKVEPMIALRHE
jgi:putative ABC transport system permease protein